jgi:sugar phosphate isomerase/epimerase
MLHSKLSRRGALITLASMVPAALAIDPIVRPLKGSRLKLGLAAYSLRKYLDLKNPSKPSMDLMAFADFAAANGCDAIEPTSYYFRDTSLTGILQLKNHCARLGLEITGSAVGNNFCLEDEGKRQAQVKLVTDWLDKVSILGGRTLRVFAGNLAKGQVEEECREWTITCLKQACDHAAKVGVFVALENHGGITATSKQLLSIVKSVDHPWFGVNLDSGNFHTDDPYSDLEAIAPYAVVSQFKSEIHPKGGAKQHADYERLVGILQKSQYSGYVILEYEAAEEPLVGIPAELKALGKVLRRS